MKIKIRKGLFETNSSSEHTVTISIGDNYCHSFCTDCEGDDEFFISEEDVLDEMPIEVLEAAIQRKEEKWRKNAGVHSDPCNRTRVRKKKKR